MPTRHDPDRMGGNGDAGGVWVRRPSLGAPWGNITGLIDLSTELAREAAQLREEIGASSTRHRVLCRFSPLSLIAEP